MSIAYLVRAQCSFFIKLVVIAMYILCIYYVVQKFCHSKFFAGLQKLWLVSLKARFAKNKIINPIRPGLYENLLSLRGAYGPSQLFRQQNMIG